MLLTLLTLALLQPAPATPAPTAPSTLIPAQTLGQRVAAVKAQTTAAPLLVIVADDPSYATAIARWNTNGTRLLYPVLYDDNSQSAREDIARFARAFKPARTLRFSAKDTPHFNLNTPEALHATLAASFNTNTQADYLAALNARPQGPLGAVATSPGDPAAPAALALAAAYGQALLLAPPPAKPTGTLTFANADTLSTTLTDQLTTLKLSYATLGDTIDALTLCYDTPVKVTAGEKDAPPPPLPQFICRPGDGLALTDVIGRTTNPRRDRRWAYATQITGTPAQSAYRAMCAIFLRPISAAAFNGYDSTGGFAPYKPTEAMINLAVADLKIATLDSPWQSIDHWRAWSGAAFTPPRRWPTPAGTQPTTGTLHHDLYLINTMGQPDNFELKPGQGHPGDLPILHTPAAVHFIHSLSLRYNTNRATIGGRWLQRGTYIYVGSVDEPFLNAFNTPADFTKRLTAGWPLAFAARIQPQPGNPFTTPWRIAILGDALWSLSPALKRADTTPDLPGAKDLAADLPTFLKDRNYTHAFDTLTMLTRDNDAARLAAAALDQEPDKIDIHAALRAVMIAHRAADLNTLTKAALKIDLPAQREQAVADAIWLALWPNLATLTKDQADLLGRTLRPDSYLRDTTDAANAIRRASGKEAANTFLQSARTNAPRPDIQQAIDKLTF